MIAPSFREPYQFKSENFKRRNVFFLRNGVTAVRDISSGQVTKINQ